LEPGVLKECNFSLWLYHDSVHALTERLIDHIRRQELLQAGDRVGVAVSGGIDSMALLRLLVDARGELGIVLSVVHFNHMLRGAESDADQKFVEGLAHVRGLEFFRESGDVALHEAGEHSGTESAARELRYSYFQYLLNEGSSDNARVALDKIATAHTLDDQAETVLLRAIRGTGLRGLGGIYPRLLGEDDSTGEIIRPLLGIRRRELEQYLKEIGQPWREDSTNSQTKFTRNRLRHRVLPLLENEFNPSVAENLAELAEIARGEEDYWETEASGWMGTAVQWSEPHWAQGFSKPRDGASTGLTQISPAKTDLERRLEEPGSLVMNASVSRAWLVTEPLAVQRRLVKAIGEYASIPLEFKHVEEILRFAAEDGVPGKELSLPLGWKLLREPESVLFLTPDLRSQERIPANYEYQLALPGRVIVPEIGAAIEALRVLMTEAAEYNPDQLLQAELLCGPLTVRNWRPGDKFWPAHTKGPKKIKELLLDHRVTGPSRKSWPVVVHGDEIVWVRELPVPAKLRAKPGQPAWLIREVSIDSDTTP
jgi:tRNA(Ile)-lysidine synthase